MATQGLWGAGGFNLPDFGLTERFTNWQANPAAVQGYGAPSSQPAQSTGMQSIPAGVSYGLGPNTSFTPGQPSYQSAGGQVLGANKSPASNPTPTGGTGTGNNNVTSTQSVQQQSSGPSAQDQLKAELDSIFNPVFSSLDQQQNTLQQNYAPVEGQIQAQGDLSKQTLSDQQASGMRDLTAQENAAGSRQTDALTSASRLYNELQRGGQQRFGGASSAGEAYQTLTATEQQRRQGDIQKSYETAMQQVGTYKANLQDKYNTAIKEVQLQTQQAVTDAQSQFRDAVQQLSSARNQAQADKATASMNALQDLRNKVYTINQQSLQFVQQLALNHEATLKQVDQYAQQALQSVGGAQTAVNQPYPTLGTNYGTTGGQQTSAPTTQTGQTTARKMYDPNDPSTWNSNYATGIN